MLFRSLLFQSLAIAAIPYGDGSALISAIYGGGPLAIFVGWIVVLVLDECVALSLGELASKYPTSAGPYYWSFQVATKGKTVLSFITGWTWLIGNCKSLSKSCSGGGDHQKRCNLRIPVCGRDGLHPSGQLPLKSTFWLQFQC